MAAQMAAAQVSRQLRELKKENRISEFKATLGKQYKMFVWLKNEVDITTLLLIWEPIYSLKPVVIEKNAEENPFLKDING